MNPSRRGTRPFAARRGWPSAAPWLVAVAIGASAYGVRAEQDGFDAEGDLASVETGPELGVRTGYAVASGKMTRGITLRERIAGAVPIAFDIGYRAHPRWFVGGYGEYAIGFASDTASERCDDCTYTWLHLSLELQYRLLVGERSDLWLGIGAGRHWFNMTLDLAAERTQTLSGPEYLNLQVGGSWVPLEGIALGPYSALSIGSFSEGIERCGEALLCPLERRDLDLGSVGAHLWFSSGVRVTFLP